MALSFPEATEVPHFDKTSFRVKNKIFSTYDQAKNHATIKLNEIDQDVFSLASEGAIYRVNNKWGKQGWTVVELEHVNNELFKDVLMTGYCEVAPPKLSKLARSTNL